MIHATAGVKLEDMLSEGSQSQKDKSKGRRQSGTLIPL